MLVQPATPQPPVASRPLVEEKVHGKMDKEHIPQLWHGGQYGMRFQQVLHEKMAGEHLHQAGHERMDGERYHQPRHLEESGELYYQERNREMNCERFHRKGSYCKNGEHGCEKPSPEKGKERYYQKNPAKESGVLNTDAHSFGLSAVLLGVVLGVLGGIVLGLLMADGACAEVERQRWWLPAPLASSIRIWRAWYTLSVSEAGAVRVVEAFAGESVFRSWWTAPALASTAAAYVAKRCRGASEGATAAGAGRSARRAADRLRSMLRTPPRRRQAQCATPDYSPSPWRGGNR